MEKRRQGARRGLWVLPALAALTAAGWLGNCTLVTTPYRLESARLPAAFSGLRSVQLSDLHGARFGRDNARLLEAVRRAEPDLIALTGDLADEVAGLADIPALLQIAEGAQRRTLHIAELAREHGMPCRTVSYGATPTFMYHVPILPGITELRPGTYALMDASQGHAAGTLELCAATVLATVISKPTDTRTILDVGAKGLTMQSRTEGISATPGKGTIFVWPEVHIEKVCDELAIVLDRAFHDRVQVGDKVRIIPVHICPVCNLYDRAYLISGERVVQELEIACRGRLQ